MPSADDGPLIEEMKGAKNGEKFKRLWNSTYHPAEYPYEADANFALCRILAFWTMNDAARIERLFNLSALAENWEWQKEKNRKTTVENAILCEDLAEVDKDKLDYQAIFKLIRRLRNVADQNPRQFKEYVADYCARSGREFEPFWIAFLNTWKKVRTAENDSELVWAASQPLIDLDDPPAKAYTQVASIAYHLSTITGEKPFYLPRKQVAEVLNTYPNNISNVVELLVDDGLLECTDSNYSYTKRKAKEYVFTGKLVL